MSIVRFADTSIFASTGLVVTGYGERELFPSVITNRLDFRLDGHLKHERQESKSNTINFERRAAIIPFAQSDMVATFIEGADPEYQRVVDTQVQNALDALFQSLADDILGVPDGHAARETLMNLSTNTWKRLKHEMDNARRENSSTRCLKF